jgi:hypothetical protein
MFLGSTGVPTKQYPGILVREYLHQEIDFTLKDWRSAGSRLGLAEPIPGDLDAQRRAHWQVLQRVYSPTAVMDWMPECP